MIPNNFVYKGHELEKRILYKILYEVGNSDMPQLLLHCNEPKPHNTRLFEIFCEGDIWPQKENIRVDWMLHLS
jgi:hypothetical protein